MWFWSVFPEPRQEAIGLIAQEELLVQLLRLVEAASFEQTDVGEREGLQLPALLRHPLAAGARDEGRHGGGREEQCLHGAPRA